MLHVFTVERVAAGLDGGGNNERIVERQAVLAGKGYGTSVRVQGDGHDIVDRGTEQPKGQLDLRPVVAKFTPGDVDKLVQHLDAYAAAPA